jgi:response regulator RpfG family c-di-GMP phosphodiesterase
MTIERFLKSAGYCVKSVTCGADAMAIDWEQLSSLIIIDTALSDMGTEELVRAIQKQRNLMKDVMQVANVPILLVAPFNEKYDEPKWKHYGVLMKIDKPLKLNVLGACVEKVAKGEIKIETIKPVNLVIMDPEQRAIDYMEKLVQSDDVSLYMIRNEAELKAMHIPIDILIFEVMGIQNGSPEDFFAEFKKERPNAMVIALTAFYDKGMHQKFIELGVKEFLIKPFHPVEFRKMVMGLVSEIKAKRKAST